MPKSFLKGMSKIRWNFPTEEEVPQSQLPEKVEEHTLLGIPKNVMQYILDYNNLILDVKSQGDNRQIFMDIMSTLTIRDDDTAMLRLAYRHMMNATEAFTQYSEMFVSEGKK